MAPQTRTQATGSLAQMTAYLWRRQGFAHDTVSGLEHPFGLYASAPTCVLGPLARQAGFRFADFTRLVDEERQAVRIRAMRYSNFIVPVRLLPAAYQAVKRDPKNPIVQIRKLGFTDQDYGAIAAEVEQVLDGQTMTAAEIKKALPAGVVEPFATAWSYVAPQMCAEGRLVRATVRGGWKSNLYTYARFDQWLPEVDLGSVSREAGQAILARAYFDDYGPASAADFQWWSGFSKAEATRAIEALGDDLVIIEVAGVPYWILAANLEALRAAPDQRPQGVRLLPVWDAYLMAYRDRTRYLANEHYDFVYDRVGNATSTLLIDGSLGGIWDMIEEKKTLVVRAALFQPTGDAVWQSLISEADRLAAAAGFGAFRLERCETPPILKNGGQNLFLSPLKDVPGTAICEG